MMKIYKTELETGILNSLKTIEPDCWIQLTQPTAEESKLLCEKTGIDHRLISKVLDEPIEKLISWTIPTQENYLDKDLYEILIKCTPAKQKLIYNIAKIVSGSNFV